MKRSGRGQSLVEFALIVPILLLLIMGTLDLGRIFYVKIALQSAAREGAYFLSYRPECFNDASACNPDAKMAAELEANNMGVHVVPSDITFSGDPTRGNPVQVSVKQVINLFILNFISGPIQLESQARMLVQ